MEMVSSKRGKEKVIVDGYCYVFDKESASKSKKFWRCEERGKCKARLHTRNGDYERVGVHNHGPTHHKKEPTRSSSSSEDSPDSTLPDSAQSEKPHCSGSPCQPSSPGKTTVKTNSNEISSSSQKEVPTFSSKHSQSSTLQPQKRTSEILLNQHEAANNAEPQASQSLENQPIEVRRMSPSYHLHGLQGRQQTPVYRPCISNTTSTSYATLATVPTEQCQPPQAKKPCTSISNVESLVKSQVRYIQRQDLVPSQSPISSPKIEVQAANSSQVAIIASSRTNPSPESTTCSSSDNNQITPQKANALKICGQQMLIRKEVIQFLRKIGFSIQKLLGVAVIQQMECDIACKTRQAVLELFQLLKQQQNQNLYSNVELYEKEEIEIKLDMVPLTLMNQVILAYLESKHGRVLTMKFVKDEDGLLTGTRIVVMMRRDLDVRPISARIDLNGQLLEVSYEGQPAVLPVPNIAAIGSTNVSSNGVQRTPERQLIHINNRDVLNHGFIQGRPMSTTQQLSPQLLQGRLLSDPTNTQLRVASNHPQSPTINQQLSLQQHQQLTATLQKSIQNYQGPSSSQALSISPGRDQLNERNSFVRQTQPTSQKEVTSYMQANRVHHQEGNDKDSNHLLSRLAYFKKNYSSIKHFTKQLELLSRKECKGDDARDLVMLYEQLQKTNDEHLTRNAALLFPTVIDMSGIALDVEKVNSFCYVLSKVDKYVQRLNLAHGNVTRDGSSQLFSAVKKMPGKIGELVVPSNARFDLSREVFQKVDKKLVLFRSLADGVIQHHATESIQQTLDQLDSSNLEVHVGDVILRSRK
ncbi:uncharacterized protein LOC143452570 [Clavelina lepadiformis]|uniref:uncharacterized protein LOC143452570 n=1 Tax=Clavelina lepadiformis TaxID=159417 RepID=UPI004042B5CC